MDVCLFFHSNIRLNSALTRFALEPKKNKERSADMRGDARRISNWVEVPCPAPSTPTPFPLPAGHSGSAGKEQQRWKRIFNFLLLCSSLCLAGERPAILRRWMDLRAAAAAEDGFGWSWVRIAPFDPACFTGLYYILCSFLRSTSPVSAGEDLAERKGDESRSADTNTHRIALFFMCSKMRCSCGGGGRLPEETL